MMQEDLQPYDTEKKSKNCLVMAEMSLNLTQLDCNSNDTFTECIVNSRNDKIHLIIRTLKFHEKVSC